MNSILITGARRGIGLELVRQFSQSGWRVYACSRAPEESLELLQLAARYADTSVHLLDVTNAAQLASLVAQFKGKPIDVLLNNAGVYGAGSQRFGETNVEDWVQTFKVNTVAPLKIMEAFVANVAVSERRVMANISSKMGSIDDNGSGGSYLYRSTKTALNAVVKSAAIDLAAQGISVVALHPGWVRTDMGGADGELSVEQGATLLRQRLCDLDLEDSGKFIDIDGTTLPW